MKQEKILSIRLSPDGLSFWTTELTVTLSKNSQAQPDLWSRGTEKAMAFDPIRSIAENMAACTDKIREAAGSDFCAVEIFPDTINNVSVPKELLREGSETGYLTTNNIVMNPGETVMNGEISTDIISLIVYNKEAIPQQNEIWGQECSVKSPFSINDSFITKYGAGRRRGASIYLTPNNVYISVYEKRSGAKLYMDTLRWTAETDILYAITLLDKEFGLQKGKIYIRGTKAEAVHNLLRKYYRKSRCE